MKFWEICIFVICIIYQVFLWLAPDTDFSAGVVYLTDVGSANKQWDVPLYMYLLWFVLLCTLSRGKCLFLIALSYIGMDFTENFYMYSLHINMEEFSLCTVPHYLAEAFKRYYINGLYSDYPGIYVERILNTLIVLCLFTAMIYTVVFCLKNLYLFLWGKICRRRRVEDFIMEKYIRQINFIVMPRKYLKYIFVCCFILQTVLYADLYIDFSTGTYSPLSEEKQLGERADILFYIWLVLITFVPLGKRMFLLFIIVFAGASYDIITLYVTNETPLGEFLCSLPDFYYKYFIGNFMTAPSLYLERIVGTLIILVFCTPFACLLTVALQVIFFLLKEFVLGIINCFRRKKEL